MSTQPSSTRVALATLSASAVLALSLTLAHPAAARIRPLRPDPTAKPSSTASLWKQAMAFLIPGVANDSAPPPVWPFGGCEMDPDGRHCVILPHP